MVDGAHEASDSPSDPLTSPPLGPRAEGDGSTLTVAENLLKVQAGAQADHQASAFAPLTDSTWDATQEEPYAAEGDEAQEEEACWQVIDDAQGAHTPSCTTWLLHG